MIAEFITIPGIILILGALILPLIPEKLRSTVFLIFPIAALVIVFARPDGYEVTGSLAGLELVLMQVDSLSRLFGIIFAATALIAGIYAWHIRDLGQQIAALVYAGSAIGVTYAGDFFTLLVYWELMAISSTWLVWARRTSESDYAGMRYLIFHVLGGGILLAGILWHLATTGSIAVTTFSDFESTAAVLILLGVAINAAVIPMHVWLPDAYPKATITGAVFMSAFTTKSAVYVLLRVFPGWELLTWFGAAMAMAMFSQQDINGSKVSARIDSKPASRSSSTERRSSISSRSAMDSATRSHGADSSGPRRRPSTAKTSRRTAATPSPPLPAM
jgi:multicomponent Na+:H+ antiporter subunit D